MTGVLWSLFFAAVALWLTYHQPPSGGTRPRH